MRSFVAFNGIGASQTMLSMLGFKVDAINKPQGLLARYADMVQPMDQSTVVLDVLQGNSAPANGQFFTFDFHMNYDPCICNNRSTFVMDFSTKDSDGSLLPHKTKSHWITNGFLRLTNNG